MNIDITDTHYSEKSRILDALYEVADPELGINIVDLGLIYDIAIDKKGKQVIIEMTLSTSSCPMGGIIAGHVKLVTESIMPGNVSIVRFVWDPKWSADRITEQGKAELGW